MESILLGLLFLIMAAAICGLAYLLVRKPEASSNNADLSASLQNLTQAVHSTKSQAAVLTEKMTKLEPIAEGFNKVRVELRGLTERVSTVEGNQNAVGHGLNTLGTSVAQASTMTDSLLESTAMIRAELSKAINGLTDLQTRSRVRQDVERQMADSVKRLETVIAGTQSKGSAGENILEMVFSKLPNDWRVRNFVVGNKTVEFGLKLPNGSILPIDSKWPATSLLEQFSACSDIEEQRRLKEQIETAVLSKAKEVKKYIDPNLTENFGVAVVPDAVYDLCCGVQVDIFLQNVVLVSYSMFIPYLLLVFQTARKSSQNIDLKKLDNHLNAAQDGVKELQKEIEGRFSTAITYLRNSRDHMGVQLSRVSSGLMNLRPDAIPQPETSTFAVTQQALDLTDMPAVTGLVDPQALQRPAL